MSRQKTLAAIAVATAMLYGLWGCASGPDTAATPTPLSTDVRPLRTTSTATTGADSTPTASEGEVIGPSEETGISREEDSQLTPSHPTQVTAQATEGAVVITWLGTGDDRIEYYQVYRRVADDERWEFITEVQAIGQNRGWYESRDSATQRGITYIYGVSAISTYGNESTISESSATTSQ